MRKKQIVTLLGISALGLLLCVIASLAFGSRNIGINSVLHTLFSGDRTSFEAKVVYERIPRTVFSIIAGASLGVSGALMQAITRNPVADPSILGVNTGASLFVVSGIAFFNISTAKEYIWFALLGAALTAFFVYRIGSMGSGGATPIKLALAGTATSAALTSIVSAIVLPRSQAMQDFRFWQVGSVSGATWKGILLVIPFIIVGILLALLTSSALNAMALGDDVATGLGVRTGLIRLVGAFAGVLLCGAVTAIAGPIGFVGLMIPHTVRLICGADMRLIIPMSAVGGAVLLTLSDVFGRLLGAPGELEAGIVTAFLGAPVLVFIAMRVKVRSL
ncbi:FecCD family ABC transporter permease [Candidatus Galacturonibacter soehngenii]|uniref:Iron ABC transporter permease n=1 Tax=Candidatus Galacturonatibacter soehngenii TaxID=2307010 RepID=A0A7V7QKP4_9FIRM|nr:iron ABC transporter permease [Candidatus Galacturonibacter soehngenii]KAB1438419.1 iron ABC transporter permease [Candidatus Galacturonibacter soehngenii]MBA4687610.1 iron ABC transporter permease [Candidatus Galacturonibacter soehngenii]